MMAISAALQSYMEVCIYMSANSKNRPFPIKIISLFVPWNGHTLAHYVGEGTNEPVMMN
jgi:hypothetical protein